MVRLFFSAVTVLCFVAGCGYYAQRPPVASPRGNVRPVVELAPSPGSGPALVLEGERAVYAPPKPGIRTLESARPQFDLYMRYDRGTESTFRGPIIGFQRVPLTGDRRGLFVQMAVGGQFPYVYLGPEEWLFAHDIRPGMADQIMVTGSLADNNGRVIMMARKIVLGSVEVHVRDANGNPYWPEPQSVASLEQTARTPPVR